MNKLQDHLTITVKSFATLREVMDTQIRMDLPEGATIRSLLAELTTRYAGLAERLFAAPGILLDFVNILRNGRNIQFLAGPGYSARQRGCNRAVSTACRGIEDTLHR